MTIWPFTDTAPERIRAFSRCRLTSGTAPANAWSSLASGRIPVMMETPCSIAYRWIVDIFISREVAEAILTAAGRAAPAECCGLLFGTVNHVTAWQETANVATCPLTAFEINPAALIEAHRNARNGGPMVTGYVHSHPGGGSTPSRTDAAQAAADGRVWLVIAAGALTAWRAVENGTVHGRFDPLQTQIGD